MLKRILALVMISFLACACNRECREELTFASWGSITEVQILKNIISDFEKANPNIKVNFQHIPQNYFQKIHLLFASNTAPDVIFINNLYLPVYADRLEDLSGITNKNDFFEKSIQALSIDGRLLAVPRDISNLVVYYNKNIIKTEPKTFEKFDSKIKHASGQKHFGISYERDIFYAEPYILTLGYDKGLDYYKSLEGKYAPSPANTGSSTQAQMFLDNKIAFYLSGRWMYPKLTESAKFPFGVMAFPEGKVYADTSGWAIPKNTKHRASAEKFVKFISSEKSINYFTSTGLIVPARKDSAKAFDNPKERSFLEAISNSVTRKPDKNYGKNRDKVNREIFR